MGIATAVSLTMRAWYVTALFAGFRVLAHSARALLPTVPAVLAVVSVRWAHGLDRSLAIALGELALYLAVTVVATLALERPLLREVLAYLRRAPRVEAVAAAPGRGTA
jgi:hypothetical protein